MKGYPVAGFTIPQVTRIYREGFDIRFRKRSKSGVKGEINPGTLNIDIYLANAESERDRDITILHELVHAWEETMLLDEQISEKKVDELAIYMYEECPWVLEYIKELVHSGKVGLFEGLH